MAKLRCLLTGLGLALQLSPGTGSRGYAEVNESQLAALLREMTVPEKLEQTCGRGCPEEYFRWGVCDWFSLLSRAPDTIYTLTDVERLKIRGMATRDGPRGMTCSLGGLSWAFPGCPRDGTSPGFPQQSLRGATWDVELLEEFGVAIGEIANQLSVHAALLPTINIMTWLHWGRGQESFGEDPFISGKLGAAEVRGIQSQGVMATPKHFLANNIENTRFWVSADMDEFTLHNVYLKAWSVIVQDSSPELIMTSYNRVQGKFPFAHPKFLGILREQLGFRGTVMTDWFSTWDKTKAGALLGEAGKASPFHGKEGQLEPHFDVIQAGTDMEMPLCNKHYTPVSTLATCHLYPDALCHINKALDRAVTRILRSKLRYGLVGDKAMERKSDVKDWDLKYSELSLRIAHEGMVLLRNEESFLPKSNSEVKSVVVLGTPDVLEMGDRGSSGVVPPPSYVVSVLDGLKAAYSSKVTFISTGTYSERPTAEEPFGSWSWTESESSSLRGADMILVDVGLNHYWEGEYVPPIGGDRRQLSLGNNETALIRSLSQLNPKIVVAITVGQAAIVEEWFDQVKAIMWMSYPGPRGGQALADILSGKINPSGRMICATPKSARDWVPDDVHENPGLGGQPVVTYPAVHGFKHMWEKKIEPRYPFGWGLSYTTFSIEEPKLERENKGSDVVVTVTVQNTGSRDGAQTVQVYGTCSSCKRRRLPITLLGFTKVRVKAGGSQRATMRFALRELAAFDGEEQKWFLEKGTYPILVGSCAHASHLKEVMLTVDAEDSWVYPKQTIDKEHITECEGYKCIPDKAAWSFNINFDLPVRIGCGAALLLTLVGLLLYGFVQMCCCCWRCARRCCGSSSVSPVKKDQ